MLNFSPYSHIRSSRRTLKRSLNIFLLFTMLVSQVYSQEKTSLAPTVKLNGYVKSDIFFDTREVISAREGHFLLSPAPVVLDKDGKDLNARTGFNMMPIHSNLGVSFNGPVTLGAALSGLVEGDFFGQSNADVNMFRLRHAYVKFQWTKTELLIGQYWHPLFVVNCYPGTISFNTGAPIQPFSRAPQVRLTHTVNKLRIGMALLTQRDNTSTGPEGNSSKYLRNSGMPEIQFTAELKVGKKNEFITGAGFGYKKLIPQTKTPSNYKTSESVQGMSANAYLKLLTTHLTIKLEGVYLENGSEFLNISGYAVKDSLDAEKGIVNYAPVRTVSFWGEIHTNGPVFQFGIFTGYTKNCGTSAEVEGPFYLTLNMPVKSLYRISPRVSFKSGNMTLAAEIEYTSAEFGIPDNHGNMINTSITDNTRYLLSVMYKF